MIWVLAFVTLSGISVVFWGCVGIVRLIADEIFSLDARRQKKFKNTYSITREEVAVLVPAYNEELTLERTLHSLIKIVPPQQIYVGSDASTDRTVEIARSFGCQVKDIFPNRGKARVLVCLLKQFHILDRYKAVMFVDADSEAGESYLAHALPFFDDPHVVAVAGHGISRWVPHRIPRWSHFFTAYRVRLYVMLQAMLRYGQTWRYTNVTSIVPGFCSVYRSSALRSIEIDAPGLIIEDFNMTFEVHHKRLGKIAYHPRVFGTSQDPQTLRDYVRQVKRWDLGFWQTVRRHGIWPSFFWLANGVFLGEMVSFAFIALLLPLVLVVFFFTGFEPFVFTPYEAFPYEIPLTFSDIVIGVFLADYLMTAAVAIFDRKPMLLVYGLGFMLLRPIDAFMYLYTLPLAFFAKSDGRWKSPKRRTVDS